MKCNKIILLIEDNEFLAGNIAEILHDYKVIISKDSKVDIENTCGKCPDLIIYDNKARVHNFRELVQHLELSNDLANAPLIFLTPKLESATKNVTGHPAVHFINKPFDPIDLLRTVETQLNQC